MKAKDTNDKILTLEISKGEHDGKPALVVENLHT